MNKNFKFIVGTVAAFAVFATVSVASAAYTHTATLKMGSRSTQVMSLQQTLNMTACKVAASGAGSMGMETTYFGPATKAAVQCFQRANGTTADGVVGPMTGAKLSAIVVTDSTLPAGCSSKTGYSTTTGIKCDTTTGTGTGTGTGTSTGPLKGGAGDLTLTSTSTDVEDDVEEGATEKVLGVEGEADDSDIAITNVKVEIESNNVGSASTRIEKYFESVSVWLGDKKVGEVDADEFSKDGDVYTKSISLSGAVISEDDEEKLYVGVTALDNVDDDAQTFDVRLTDVRYTDATGAILSESGLNYANIVGFDEEGVDDELTIKSSSANPDSSTIAVDEDEKSDDMLVLAFNLEADEDSSDVTINELPINIDLTAVGGGLTENLGTVINEVYVKIGSKEYEADRDSTSTSVDGTYTVEFDNDEFVIDSGDTEEVKVYVVFNKQDGNYDVGTKISATVNADEIDAEGADDLTASNLNGTASGKVHTLEVDAPMITLDSKSFALAQSIDGVDAGEEDIFEAKFNFTVKADDETVYLPFMSGTTSNSIVTFTTTGSPVIQSIIIDAANDDIEEDNSYEITDEEEFTLTFTLRGNNATNSINVTGFGLSEDDNTSVEFPVTGGLSDFKSVSKYLAK